MPPGSVYCRPCKRQRSREASERYRRALGRKPADRPKLGPPESFAQVAGTVADVVLAERFGVSATTIGEWRKKLGVPRISGGRLPRPIPTDWHAQCAAASSAAALTRMYRAKLNVLKRWAAESGTTLPSGQRGPRPAELKVRPERRVVAKPAGQRGAALDGVTARSVIQHLARVADAAPVERVASCRECTRERACRAHQVEQLRADVEAWMAQGNRPHEVPQGATGLQLGWGRPAQ
jgi:hypothetical protein